MKCEPLLIVLKLIHLEKMFTCQNRTFLCFLCYSLAISGWWPGFIWLGSGCHDRRHSQYSSVIPRE